MKRLGIIPARFASSRFPGKPLADIAGKSMIQRVYERSVAANCFDTVVVATDNQEILSHVSAFGGKAELTSTEHRSGTDRCAELLQRPAFAQVEIVVNIQGDEPFLDPGQLQEIVASFEDQSVEIATIATPLQAQELLHNPNTPKVVKDKAGNALYFSRQAIPFLRDQATDWVSKFPYLKHVGLYGFRAAVLTRISQLEPSQLELAESLEQLRWLENGYKIRVLESPTETFTVDTPEDLDRILSLLKKGELSS